MKHLRRVCAWMCALVIIVGCVPFAVAEGGDLPSMEELSTPGIEELPALVVTHAVSPGQDEFYVLTLFDEMNGKWLWLQVPDSVALGQLALSYRPLGEGVVYVSPTFGGDSTLQAVQGVPNPGGLDFSPTETMPYAFVVQGLDDASQAIWSGWITVSHQARPADLPDVPSPTLAPITEPPVTEPPITEPPVTEPPVTEPPITEPPITEPPVTEPPVTEPPITPPPVTEPPVTAPPVTQPPITPPPVTPPPITPPPVTQPPITPPPVTQPPYTLPPVTPPPTWWPTFPPVSEAGYGLITANNVNLRDVPNGNIRARLYYGDVIYINGQSYDAYGSTWHAVNVVEKGVSGYVNAGFARFMTAQEVYDYLNRPTPGPTPSPTPWVTPTPYPSIGYARVTWQSASLRSAPGVGASVLRTLGMGSVVYVTGQVFDAGGTRWFSVRPQDNAFGYLMAASVVMMTPQEVTDYLDSLKPTPRPTAVPTLNPNYSYAVVKMDNVNFRYTPNGNTIRRVNTGTVAQLLAESGTYSSNHIWYYVRIGNDDGYLRADMIDFIQIKPSPTPKPTATATPTPRPTPVATPLPTSGPLTLLDRIRMTVDTARYTEYARERAEAVSYAVRDLDSDKLAELLLVTPQRRANGTQAIILDAYKLAEGQVRRVATREVGPLLSPKAMAQVVVLEQSGRTVVYVEQYDSTSGQALGNQGWTLTENGWTDIPLGNAVKDAQVILYAESDEYGRITWKDLSGLHVAEDADEPAGQDGVAFAAILQVLVNLLQNMSRGNG